MALERRDTVHLTDSCTGWAKKVIPLVQCNICTSGITFLAHPVGTVADSTLVDQQRKKLWNRLMMTPVVRRTVHCLPTADAFFLVASKLERQRLVYE